MDYVKQMFRIVVSFCIRPWLADRAYIHIIYEYMNIYIAG